MSHSLTYSCDGTNTTWVTVFGFPPSAASYILKQFSQCGTVLQHHVPVNGNWMNIRYQTRNQAQSALSRSGRVLSGTLMIGVVLTPDAEAQALTNGSEGILDQTGSGSRATGLNTSVTTLNNTSINGGTPNRSIRPLAQAYKAAHSEHEVRCFSNRLKTQIRFFGFFLTYFFSYLYLKYSHSSEFALKSEGITAMMPKKISSN